MLLHNRQAEEDKTDIPMFECDYHFMSTCPKTPWTKKPADDPKSQLKLFSIKEKKSKSLFCTVVESKGISESDAAVNYFIECIADLGYAHTTIHLKNDQEPAIVAVIDELKRRRVAQTLVIC